MADLWNQTEFDRRYGKRLAIVVPYRDRTEHLTIFVKDIRDYFHCDKLDRYIQVSIHIVEQHGKAPFNAGMIRNCGFLLTRKSSDYTCFHDVDYLPIWADYSWSTHPARLIWRGLRLREHPDEFFGGVVLFDNAAFERVNGYPNVYWGWGPEDFELGLRCKAVLGGFDHRDGTFVGLPHDDRGFVTPGVLSPEAKRTYAIAKRRLTQVGELIAQDGLSTFGFRLIEQKRVCLDGNEVPNAFHYLVDIGEPPAELYRDIP